MALESATYVNQLIAANPTATDPVGQGDDHIRLLKAALLATFPNFTAAALASTNAAIDTATTATANAGGNALVPSGCVMHFAGSAAPAGWLLCDGNSYPTTVYPALFAAIGYAHGGSGGSFLVPDCRGRVIAGVDSATGRLNGSGIGGGALGVTGGEGAHALIVGELAYHTHADSGHSHGDAGHSHADAGHGHAVAGWNDPGHNHTLVLYDPGHSHGVNDLGHTHAIEWGEGAGGSNNQIVGKVTTGNVSSQNTSYDTTGISINGATTGINAGNTASTTGISFYIGTGNANIETGYASIETAYANNAYTGSSTAHNNVQPTIILNHIIKT